jgi:drug/metabolite transporter (DMT)-like permease
MNDLKTISSKRLIRAIILTVAASCCYSIMTLLAKLVAGNTTGSITVFFRSIISLLWIISILGYKKLRDKQFSIKTKHFGLHLLRAGCSFTSMLSLYYALKYVPLADATSLAITYTLFIPILSFIFLDTRTNIKTWLAIITGFTGIVFILKPYSNDFNPITLIALISGITTAGSMVGVHELAREEKPETIMLYFFSLTFILSGIFTIFNWETPSLNILITLFMIGIAGTAYQDLTTRAMSYAPPKIVAPLLYFSIIFNGLFDWVFWHHIPDLYFWFGTTLIAAGCIFSVKYTRT